jgi:hypothetical protein
MFISLSKGKNISRDRWKLWFKIDIFFSLHTIHMIFLVNNLGVVFCFKFICSPIYYFLNSKPGVGERILRTDRKINVLGFAEQEDVVK